MYKTMKVSNAEGKIMCAQDAGGIPNLDDTVFRGGMENLASFIMLLYL